MPAAEGRPYTVAVGLRQFIILCSRAARAFAVSANGRSAGDAVSHFLVACNGLLSRWSSAVVLLLCAAVVHAVAAHADTRPSVADPASSGAISVVHAWSRATAGGAPVGVVYFEVLNSGPADTLLAIECPAAERVEMHATTRVDGVVKMRPVPSVDVPAGGRVSFQPGGLHAMLIGIKQPLKDGGRLPFALVFRRAGKLQLEATIQGLGTADPPSAQKMPRVPSVP